MSNPPSQSPAIYRKKFFKWSKTKRDEFLAELSPLAAQELLYCADFWLRDKQIVHDGDWSVWIIKAGRGFGKTRAGAAWMKKCILNHEPINNRHDLYAMCGPTHKDVKDVMIPALLALFTPTEQKQIKWNRTDGDITFPNGAIVYSYSSETEIRGPNIQKCWVDELAKWWKPDEQYELLEYAVRVGNPQILVTTTPKKTIKTIRKLIAKHLTDPDRYVMVEGDSFENTSLPASYFHRLEELRGTRKFRQEALGEMLDDSEDALFPESSITDHRVESAPINEYRTNLPLGVNLVRIVVAVDPAGTAHPDSDETGIIVAGSDDKGHAYLLEDASGRYSPDGWASKAVELYHAYQANWIVGEKNFGGDMVKHTIKTVDGSVPFKELHASRGKALRAEPVAAKYIQGMVHHVGKASRFDKLEDQMTYFTGAPSTDKHKDDRLDAMVWAISELLITGTLVQRHFLNLPNFS